MQQPRSRNDVEISLRDWEVARRRIALALRQERRAQDCYREFERQRGQAGHTSGLMPASLQALELDFDDAARFAVVAARHAVMAYRYLVKEGAQDLPRLRDEKTVMALRDLDEHWDEWEPLDPETHEKRWLRTRSAGARWEAASSAVPEGHYSAVVGGSVTNWHGLDLARLGEDLTYLWEVVSVRLQAVYDFAFPTESEALAMAGGEAKLALARRWGLTPFHEADGQVRYPRDRLVALINAQVD